MDRDEGVDSPQIGICEKCDALSAQFGSLSQESQTDRRMPYPAGRFGTKLVTNFPSKPNP